jgi:hypothetical protein
MTPNEYAAAIDDMTAQLELLKQEAFPAEAREKLRRGICLNCDNPIGNAKSTRGCDANCYQSVKRDIDAGVYSDGMAIAKGLLTPEQKSGRKPTRTGGRAAIVDAMKPSPMMAAESPAKFNDDDEPVVAAPVGRKTAKKEIKPVKKATKAAKRKQA